MNFLKNHPFAVEAFFESSLVLTFAVPKEQLQALIPACLELDVFQERWAFIAVAMVKTKDLRPKGFPKFLGNNFFLIGYRIFVRHTNAEGKRRRGLYILKSETDQKKMALLGNIFTHYNYSYTEIQQTQSGNRRSITSVKSGFQVMIENTEGEISMPVDSPFSSWQEARRYAGPLPFTFYHDAVKNTVLTVEGMRQNWHPQPLKVLQADFDFLKSLGLQNAVLANAFEIRNVPYWWKKGYFESTLLTTVVAH